MSVLPSPQTARHGEKTIALQVRLWTDNLGQPKGTIYPRHGWASGQVYVMKNDSHGIRGSQSPVMFNNLNELPAAVERVLAEVGITVHKD